MPDDLQQQDTFADSVDASASSSPVEQSQNWEQRFKGLQTKFNDLQRSISGKDAYNTRVTQEKQVAERQLTELQAQYEGQLNSIKADTLNISKEKETYASRVQQLESELAARDARDSIRKELTQRHGDLLGWFESGYLTVPQGEDGKPLSGDALDAHLTGFRGLLGQKSTQDFQTAMSGATPPQFGTPASPNVGSMNVEQLETWLNNPVNINHPDRSRLMEAYLASVEKRSNIRFQATDSDWLNQV